MTDEETPRKFTLAMLEGSQSYLSEKNFIATQTIKSTYNMQAFQQAVLVDRIPYQEDLN